MIKPVYTSRVDFDPSQGYNYEDITFEARDIQLYDGGRVIASFKDFMVPDYYSDTAGMILDSAFSDLTTLAEEIVDKGRKSGMNVCVYV